MNHKLALRLMTLLLFTGNALFAQSTKKFELGFMFGINRSSFNDRIGEFGDNVSVDYQNFFRISPVVGLKGRLKLTNTISLQPELNYNLRGGSYRLENKSVFFLGGADDEKAYFYKNYRLNYLEIPLLVSFNLGNPEADDTRLKVRLSTGLAPAINAGSSLRYNGFRTIPNGSPLSDVKENYRSEPFDHAEDFINSYILDLSFDFQNRSEQKMFVNIRLSKTLTDVYNVERLDRYNMRTKMTTICLAYGLMF